MHDLKNFIGIIAVIVTFAGYIPYLRDLLKGTTIPHLYSWFLWCLVTTLVFALQLIGGAGTGAFVTLAAALMCIVVIFLGLKQKAKIKITISDTLFLLLALISIQYYSLQTALYPVTWLLANGLFAVMLIIRRKTVAA